MFAFFIIVVVVVVEVRPSNNATIDEYVYLSQQSKMEIDLELAEFSSRTIDKFNCIQMRITKTAIIAAQRSNGNSAMVCQSIAYRSIGIQNAVDGPLYVPRKSQCHSNCCIIAPNKFQCQFTTIRKSFDLLPFSIGKHTLRSGDNGAKIDKPLPRQQTKAFASILTQSKLCLFSPTFPLTFDCLFVSYCFCFALVVRL